MPIKLSDKIVPYGSNKMVDGKSVDISTATDGGSYVIQDDDIFLVDDGAQGTEASTYYVTGAQLKTYVGSITIDSSITDGSTNPVQNNAVYDALALKLDTGGGTVTGHVTLNPNVRLTLGDAGEYITGDGTDLHITSSNDIFLTGTTLDLNNMRVLDANRISFNAGGTLNAVLDEDDMASDNSLAVPTQQSVKAYVDSKDEIFDVHESGVSWRMGIVNSQYVGTQSLGSTLTSGDFGVGEMKYAMYNAHSACTLTGFSFGGYSSSSGDEPYQFRIIKIRFTDGGTTADTMTDIATVQLNGGSDLEQNKMYKVSNTSLSQALAQGEQVYVTCAYTDGSGSKYLYGSITLRFNR
jgi:hypothetical protein